MGSGFQLGLAFWRRTAVACLLPLLVMVGGCGRKIGDACTTSADCDPSTGSRTCDLSQPGGYCVIEGCDARSCPEDSFCVRFFPQNLVTAASQDPPRTMTMCYADEEWVGTETDGVCVRRSLEKRICVQVCGSDSDCRGGYVCMPTGQDGAIPLTLKPDQYPKYCRPAPAK